MSEAEVTTLLLRFRDLGTGPGQTVAQHQTLIRRHGYAWWAWWNKAGEQVPRELFQRLRTVASENGLDVLLYDSGRSLLYAARIRDVAFRDNGAPFGSPERRATPNYYRREEYRAWFRLDNIQPVDQGRVRDFTYARVDAFFESGSSRFSQFYGKRVDSLEELHDQNRTIWFLRAFRRGDSGGRISLLDGLRNEASAFPRRFSQSDSSRLLWLSDLHLSSSREEHGYPLDPSPTQKPLAQAVERALGAEKAIGGLLVSGDLTWRGDADEYALVSRVIRDLRSWSALEPSQVGLIPGNHDLAFSTQPYAKSELVTHTSAEARAAYSAFYEDQFFQPPNAYLSMGRRLLLRNAIPVEVVFLNSSMLQQARGQFQGHGFLGDDQLDDTAAQMGWAGAGPTPRAYRIVVLHHHLLPMTYRIEPESDAAYSTVLDAEALMRWLVLHRVDLVLHGHMHQPGIAKVTRPIDVHRPDQGSHGFSVVALGSTGVASRHLGEIAKNTFGILDFASGMPEFTLFSIHPTNPPDEIWTVRLPLDP